MACARYPPMATTTHAARAPNRAAATANPMSATAPGTEPCTSVTAGPRPTCLTTIASVTGRTAGAASSANEITEFPYMPPWPRNDAYLR